MSTSMTAAPPRDGANPETAIELFSGSSRDPNEITTRIENAMRVGNVLSPMTQCPTLPPFHEVAVSAVKADCEVNEKGFPVRPGEIYMIARNQYGLGKPFLNRIKRAVGVVWVPEQCGRRDDESDSYFVRHFSFGVVQKFDGGIETIKGTKTLDLRDGSARVKKIIAKKIANAIYDLRYDARDKNYKITDEHILKAREEAEQKAWDDINERRAEIETNAETGSEMRALRSLGLKTSYTLKELQKPFIIFSLVVTGKHDKPEMEDYFDKLAAKAALDSRRSLYGSSPLEPMTIPAHVMDQPTRRMPPPPVGVGTEDDLDDLGGPAIDVEAQPFRGSIDDAADFVEGEEVSAEASPATKTATKSEPKSQPVDLVMPFGDHAGKYLDDSSIEIEDLQFVKEWLVGAIANPEKAENKLHNSALKDAIDVELRRRRIPADKRSQTAETKQAASTRARPTSDTFDQDRY